MQDKGIAEILTKAAEVIERNGWTQGSYVGPLEIGQNICDGPVCVRGAINVAAGLSPSGLSEAPGRRLPAYIATHALSNWLEAQGALKEYQSLADDWNDRPSRTAEQVTAALRGCAAEMAGTAS